MRQPQYHLQKHKGFYLSIYLSIRVTEHVLHVVKHAPSIMLKSYRILLQERIDHVFMDQQKLHSIIIIIIIIGEVL